MELILRGITEERLIKLLKSHLDEETIEALIEWECKELNTWQPIKTAPKDRRILLYFDKGYEDAPILYTGKFDHTVLGYRPTHWQELPSLPQISELPGDPK